MRMVNGDLLTSRVGGVSSNFRKLVGLIEMSFRGIDDGKSHHLFFFPWEAYILDF